MNHELTLLLVEVFDDDESAQESVFVVNKPVIHFFLPLPAPLNSYLVTSLKCRCFLFCLVCFFLFSVSLIFISSLNSRPLFLYSLFKMDT